jgi:hypothetical protein
MHRIESARTGRELVLVKYHVDVQLLVTMEVDTKYKEHYPSEIFLMSKSDEDDAKAMAKFDALNSDEPLETFAFSSGFGSLGEARVVK